MKKHIILSIVVLVFVGLGGFFLEKKYQFFGYDEPTPTPDELPIGISTEHPECRLTGDIVFIDEKISRTQNAGFSYSKVTDDHDFIRWTISPEEDVTIGPNRFSSLKLPAGKETITVAFNQGRPQKKSYELKASIDYPYVVDNVVRVLNKKCEGSTKIQIAY